MPEDPRDERSSTELWPLVYDQMRAIAAGYMRKEKRGHTLQPTALVHEAYLRLAGSSEVSRYGRTHLLVTAARTMRRILVDHARKRRVRPRKVTLDEDLVEGRGREIDVLLLDEALERLAGLSPRQSLVAELRLYGGLTQEEMAEHLGVSERTVRADWTVARAWLARELAA